MTKSALLAIVFLLLYQNPLTALVLTVEEPVESYILGPYLDLLEDKSGEWTIYDVCYPDKSSSFQTSSQDVPNYGFTDSVFWVRFTLNNPSDKDLDRLLELDYPTMNLIELYEPNSRNSFDRRVTGDIFTIKTRELNYRSFVFNLKIPANTSTTYYIKFHSNAINLPLILWHPKAFTEHVILWQLALGVYCGILIVIILYNFFLYVSIRESVYLYYILYVFGFLMTQLSLNGIATQLFWTESIWWANHSLLIFAFGCLFFAQQFARSFLITAQVIPRFDKILSVLMGVSAFGFVLSLISYNLAIQFLSISSFFIILIWIIASVICLKKGVHTARYFLIAWAVFIAGNILHLFKTFGVFPTNFFTLWMDDIGSAMEVILLSLGLASRINRMKQKEKEISIALQVQNLELEEKNLALKDYEKTLEQRIEERTNQINLKNLQLRKALDGLQISSQRYKLAKEEAETANASKSEFLANMSHELRTPMQGILGFSKLGIDKIGILDEGRIKGFFDEINASGHRLMHLLNDLLDLSRLESRKEEYDYKPIRMTTLVITTLNELEALLSEKSLKVAFQEPKFPDIALLDKDKILQVLRNLISNAIKFTPESGDVKIEIIQLDDYLQTSVIDNGIGIPENELESIFDKFIQSSRSKTAAGGTGLGLAICHNIITAHGGKIWAENPPQGGAIFRFILPNGR
jgi:signal transduction histidine kinase